MSERFLINGFYQFMKLNTSDSYDNFCLNFPSLGCRNKDYENHIGLKDIEKEFHFQKYFYFHFLISSRQFIGKPFQDIYISNV